MRIRGKLCVAGVLAFVAFAVYAGSLYTLSGYKWKYNTSINWYTYNLSSDWQSTFATAMQKWNAAPGSFHMYLGSGNNVVMEPSLSPQTLGYTQRIWCVYDFSSFCNGMTIQLNPSKTWSHSSQGTVPAGTYDAEWVALHEMGHALGLDHATGTSQVMYGLITVATMRRTLQAGDKAGYKALYP